MTPLSTALVVYFACDALVGQRPIGGAEAEACSSARATLTQAFLETALAPQGSMARYRQEERSAEELAAWTEAHPGAAKALRLQALKNSAVPLDL